MDKRTIKLMTMHKGLHPKDDVARLYVSRKKEGIGIANMEDSVDTSIRRFEDDIKRAKQKNKKKKKTNYGDQK